MADIKVRDREYTQAANAVAKTSAKLVGYMDEYCAALKYVSENAIKDRQITYALEDISSKVAAIRQNIEEAAEGLKSECSNYVARIDAADSYLYGT